MNLDLSNASGPDCIPVVVLKNCESKLFYILAELFNKCLKKSCFPHCSKVSSLVPVFKNIGERSTAKNYRPVSPLSVVSKVFEKLVNDSIVDQLEKCFLIFRVIKRITRSAIIVEINTKDVKLVETNISSLRSKRHLQSNSLFT